jgi:hypothetical protein
MRVTRPTCDILILDFAIKQEACRGWRGHTKSSDQVFTAPTRNRDTPIQSAVTHVEPFCRVLRACAEEQHVYFSAGPSILLLDLLSLPSLQPNSGVQLRQTERDTRNN